MKFRIYRSETGMSLVEVMVSMGIASMLSLSVATSVTYLNRSMRTAQNQQELNEYMNQVMSYMNSQRLCPLLFAGNPQLGRLTTSPWTYTPTMIRMPANTSAGSTPLFQTGQILNNAGTWQVASVLMETSSAINPAFGVKQSWWSPSPGIYPLFTTIVGQVKVELDNLRNQPGNRQSFGSQKIFKTFPFTITMSRSTSGSNYVVQSCSGNDTYSNTGYSGTGECTAVAYLAGCTGMPGYYMAAPTWCCRVRH